MFEHTDPNDLVSPFNIIFSCVICQKTIGDLYPKASGHDDIHETHEIGESHCKLWLAKCAHLLCTDHLKDTCRLYMLYDIPSESIRQQWLTIHNHMPVV
jgi:hypothetical protein